MRQLEKEKQKKEHILVCLSSSPSNEKIIRTAAQMAQAFQAGFTALYVQTAEKTEKTPEDLARLQKHVRLAEQSGAEIVTTHSEDIALQIAEYARISEVTRIVIGKSMMKQGYFHQRRVWTERLTDLVPDLEIHIIPDSDVYRRYQKRKKFPEWMELPSWKELMLTVLILAAATGIGEIFFRLGFTDANIITVYLFGVMLTSILTSGYTCSVVSSVASVVLFNYFMTEPRLSLHAYGSGYPVTFAIMLGTSILTSTLASKLKENAKLSARDAFRTKILFNTSQLLQKVEDASEIFDITATQLIKLLGRNLVVAPVEKKKNGIVQGTLYNAETGIKSEKVFNEKEQEILQWVLKNRKRAGAMTERFSEEPYLYLSIYAAQNRYGVIGIFIGQKPLDAFENSILLSILGECAMALAKAVGYLSAEFLMGKQLRNALLNAGLTEQFDAAVKELGFSVQDVVDAEHEPGLGNGGLGRLAACFIDSLASLGVPAFGYGIQYKYGIFEQKFDENGKQIETPDYWLTNEEPWGHIDYNRDQKVSFGGEVVEEDGKKVWKPAWSVMVLSISTI